MAENEDLWIKKKPYFDYLLYSGINQPFNSLVKSSTLSSLLEPLEAFIIKNNSALKNDSISVYLGKNQIVILRLFQENNSFFLTDLKELISLDKVTLDSSLRALYMRGILFRKKESNPYSANHLKHFKYCLTELGKKIKVEQSKT